MFYTYQFPVSSSRWFVFFCLGFSTYTITSSMLKTVYLFLSNLHVLFLFLALPHWLGGDPLPIIHSDEWDWRGRDCGPTSSPMGRLSPFSVLLR